MRGRFILPTAMALLVTACGGSTQGPTTWIDRPLDGMHVPLAKVTLLAHASDVDGVASIEFSLSMDLLSSVDTGGERLGQASMEWTPPGPGVYQIVARGIDTGGNYGPQASALITVGELPASAAPPPAAEEPPTATPALQSTSSSTPSPTPGGPSLTLIQNAHCRAGPGTVYASQEVLAKGVSVPIEGRNADNSWVWVRVPEGNRHCWVSVAAGQVTGDLTGAAVVAAPPPPVTPTEPDSTPPDITDYGASPALVQKAGCGEPSTTLVTAAVNDVGGVGRVVARVLGLGEFEMSPLGGQLYQVPVGPFGDVGEYSILILAWDGAGNGASAGPITVTVVCIG